MTPRLPWFGTTANLNACARIFVRTKALLHFPRPRRRLIAYVAGTGPQSPRPRCTTTGTTSVANFGTASTVVVHLYRPDLAWWSATLHLTSQHPTCGSGPRPHSPYSPQRASNRWIPFFVGPPISRWLCLQNTVQEQTRYVISSGALCFLHFARLAQHPAAHTVVTYPTVRSRCSS